MTSWNLNIWNSEIWFSRERKELLLQWNNFFFLISRLFSFRLKKQTSENVVYTTLKYLVKDQTCIYNHGLQDQVTTKHTILCQVVFKSCLYVSIDQFTCHITLSHSDWMVKLYTSAQSFCIINVKNPILHYDFWSNYVHKPVCMFFKKLLLSASKIISSKTKFIFGICRILAFKNLFFVSNMQPLCKCNPALQQSTGQWSITTNLVPLTAHIYHVMIIVTSSFSRKSFFINIFFYFSP